MNSAAKQESCARLEKGFRSSKQPANGEIQPGSGGADRIVKKVIREIMLLKRGERGKEGRAVKTKKTKGSPLISENKESSYISGIGKRLAKLCIEKRGREGIAYARDRADGKHKGTAEELIDSCSNCRQRDELGLGEREGGSYRRCIKDWSSSQKGAGDRRKGSGKPPWPAGRKKKEIPWGRGKAGRRNASLFFSKGVVEEGCPAFGKEGKTSAKGYRPGGAFLRRGRHVRDHRDRRSPTRKREKRRSRLNEERRKRSKIRNGDFPLISGGSRRSCEKVDQLPCRPGRFREAEDRASPAEPRFVRRPIAEEAQWGGRMIMPAWRQKKGGGPRGVVRRKESAFGRQEKKNTYERKEL